MTESGPPDLRLPVLAAAWSSAIVSNAIPSAGRLPLIGLVLIGLCVVLRRAQPGRAQRTLVAVVLLSLAVALVVALRGAVVQDSWLAVTAKERAVARLVVEVRDEPRLRPGQTEDRATVRVQVSAVEARGRRSTAAVGAVLALAAKDAMRLRVGARYELWGRLAPSPFAESAATVLVSTSPRFLAPPGVTDRITTRLRDAIEHAVDGQTAAAGLVPALVDGDERVLPSGVKSDFQAAGLSHLLAVSGTNFVLLGAAWLTVARRCGVRGRGLVPVGLAGIAFLVLLARAEPSVLRAAVMGGVALVGLGHGRRDAGFRALSACVCGVMLFDPALAVSPGFALSALATGGILLVAPVWRDALMRWMPRVLAETIAVSLAAYLACLPLIVALSGRLSLVALPANLAAGVAVGPATVLGFLAGFVELVLPALGRVIAAPAAWCASWIVAVAHTASGLPHPDIGVAATAVVLGIVTGCCVALMVLLGRVLHRPAVALPLLAASLVAPLTTVPGSAWPPAGWAMIACDVGQGDGLVVQLGNGRGLVVDTGPDPDAMRRCLRDLHVTAVPELVLTHFHSDHVNGLTGVLDSARVSTIEVTDLAEPAARASFVRQAAAAARIPLRIASPGEQQTAGDVTWEVLAPLAAPPASSDSPPNDASVVILVQVRGIRMLLSGDEETGSQELFAKTYPDLKIDVLKVAHHGSAKQDPALIARLGATQAIISAGAGNRYGLPKASTLALLRQAGMQVHRTDRDGAIAVVVGPSGELSVTARG